MSKLRFGVLSTSKFALRETIPAMQAGHYTEVAAIASRDLPRAQAVASEHGIPRAYGSYEELLADDEVDAIYNPLPNHLHVPWSIKALEAGKHVLCEKPIALTAAEAGELAAAAEALPKLKVMEAFMVRHHPQWQRAREIVTEGGIGALRTVHNFFSYHNIDPDNIRNRADVGGGGILDIGCYCITTARLIFGEEPRRVCGLVEYDPQLKTDRLASGMLEFPTGTATFTCSTQITPYQRTNIFGTTGRVEIEIPFNAPAEKPCKMWHEREGNIEEILLPTCNQYTLQGDNFARAVLDNTPVLTPISDAVANMRVIESLVESGQSSGWVSIIPE